MKRFQKGNTTMGEIFVWCTIIFLCVCVTSCVNSYGCSEKWKESGFKSKYNLFAGCQIETKPGRWIPEERYREIDE